MSSNEPVATAPKRQAGPFTFLPRSHSEAPVPMAVHQKRALRAAGVFFGTWLLLALASADFLPPPGFVIVLLILFACVVLVRLHVPLYLRWEAESPRGRTLKVARDGLLGGGAIALLSLFSPGEPSIHPELSDRLIGIGVLFGLGSAMRWRRMPLASAPGLPG